MTSTAQRSIVLGLLAALMAATRVHHFDPIPDASWAVFFIGGFYLKQWTRWAFPALMALAVAIDWFVITSQGMSFWQHYCVSPAYWFLVPAYFTLWAGGLVLRRYYDGVTVRSTGALLATFVAATVACQLLSQGSFYWISASVATPSLAGWWKNYSDWLPLYMQTAAMYVGVATVLHVLAVQGARLQAPGMDRRAPR